MTALTQDQALDQIRRSPPARRTRSMKTTTLATVVLVFLCLGAVLIGARGATYVMDEFLRRRAAVTGSHLTPYPGAEMKVKPRPVDRGAQSVPLFDEFAVRAIVNEVPAPAGTGLPNIESVIITPGSVVPLTINLEVKDADNAAWSDVTGEERRRYAEDVLAAVAARYPEVEATNRGWSRAYYILDVWERFQVAADLMTVDPDLICTAAPQRGRYQECRGGGLGVMVEVPVWN